MALAGTLKDFGLADIFQLIGMQKKTGVLTLRGPEETVHVLFEDGKIVYADSESKRLEDRLGTVLVMRGLLSEDKLNEALEKQKQTLRRLGHILVNDGFMSREQMQEALYLQVTQILYRLFRWRDGEYQFSQEETIDYDKENFVPISPESILMEGMQMIDEWPIIEKKIRSFDMVFAKADTGESSIQVKADEEEDGLDDSFDWGDDGGGSGEAAEESTEEGVIRLSPHEAKVYELIDGERSVREITYRSPLNEFGTCRILYDLLSRNLIQEVRAKKAVETEAEAPAAALPRDRHPLVAALGISLLLVVSVAALATFWMNPWGLSRWFLRSGGVASDFAIDVSRMRLERIHYALQVRTVQAGSLPTALHVLVDDGFLAEQDLKDPWGRPYDYHREDDLTYVLRGFDADGQISPDLVILGDIELRAARPSSPEGVRTSKR